MDAQLVLYDINQWSQGDLASRAYYLTLCIKHFVSDILYLVLNVWSLVFGI